MKIQKMAEAQIKKAIDKGELDNLAGAGKPLPAQGGGDFADSVGYRIMAEAGAVPEEIRLRKAVEAQAAVLAGLSEPAERKAAMAKLAELQMRLSMQQEARRAFEK